MHDSNPANLKIGDLIEFKDFRKRYGVITHIDDAKLTIDGWAYPVPLEDVIRIIPWPKEDNHD